MNVSTCAGTCPTSWPPLSADEAPVAGAGTAAAKLGTITRADGQKQVTVDGWPRYYRDDDAAAGDTKGQGVGTTWWVVSPFGGPVQTAATLKAATPAQFGTCLTVTNGRALYTFARDHKNKTNCTGGCAQDCQ